ncbi:MAG: hypothetical protein PHP70_05725 [Gallionella sp.]|nr:hypothetical protein [Gallionella sp.]
MNYLFLALVWLFIGMIILMACILIYREPEQSLQNAFHKSLGWGAAFFLSFSTEASIVYAGLI